MILPVSHFLPIFAPLLQLLFANFNFVINFPIFSLPLQGTLKLKVCIFKYSLPLCYNIYNGFPYNPISRLARLTRWQSYLISVTAGASCQLQLQSVAVTLDAIHSPCQLHSKSFTPPTTIPLVTDRRLHRRLLRTTFTFQP